MILCKIMRAMASYLHIAENPIIAKTISQTLSKGQIQEDLSLNLPVFRFDKDGNNHTFLTVYKYILESKPQNGWKRWSTSNNNIQILTKDVSMIRLPLKGMEMEKHILEEFCSGKTELVLWMDCDLNGRQISFDVVEIIQQANPSINIRRAPFSFLTQQNITRAFNNLKSFNLLSLEAARFRNQISFRMASAFMRYQTLTFQKKYKLKDDLLIKYGICLTPTLGLVVNRYHQILKFKPERYWVIQAQIKFNQQTSICLVSDKGSIKDQAEAKLVFSTLLKSSDNGNALIKGKVIERNIKDVKIKRPQPLTISQFIRLASEQLNTSQTPMKIAVDLYQQGYITNPYKTTDKFPTTLSISQHIKQLSISQDYSEYIQKMMNQGLFMQPTTGDETETQNLPMFPLKAADRKKMRDNQWRVYDLITRHFLACCSKDAIATQSQIVVEIGCQRFCKTTNRIKQHNFMNIKKSWQLREENKADEIPNYFQAAVKLEEYVTQRPSFLTQSDLIKLMDMNKIGTASTIHEHIEKIQKDKYAEKVDKYIKPTNLGAAIIDVYKRLGLNIEDSRFHRLINQRMIHIENGSISREQATVLTLSEGRHTFQTLKKGQDIWLEEIGQAMQRYPDLPQIILQDKKNKTKLDKKSKSSEQKRD